MSISTICVAMLAFLCIGLGFYVSLVRGKTDSLYGGASDPESKLYKAQRAHGNTIEYAPILALIIYVLGQAPQPSLLTWCMVLVTVCRFVIVLGILLPQTMAKPNGLRFVGALGTYLGGLVLAVALLMQAMSA